jgi:hypothetical protein
MTDYTALHDDIDRRMAHLLGDVTLDMTPAERAEITEFLAVREFGLALETLSGVLVEEKKQFGAVILGEIDAIAQSMGLRDQMFIYKLHNYFDGQAALGRG